MEVKITCNECNDCNQHPHLQEYHFLYGKISVPGRKNMSYARMSFW